MFEYEIYCLEGEIWKDIPEYENLYQASNFGRIRSLDGKQTYTKRHGIRTWKGRILKNKTKIPSNSGYKVSLWKDGKEKIWLVHRLIAMTFLGIPNGLEIQNTGKRMTVNHKNGDRFNNKIENLEWVTLEENIRHAFDNNLMSACKKISIEENGNVRDFKSMSEASVYLGKNCSYISNVIKKNGNIRNKKGKIVNIITNIEKGE